MDMIGHCFLAVAMIDGDNPPPGALAHVPAPADLVPNCGYPRCVEHPKVRAPELIPNSRAIYERNLQLERLGLERRVVGIGHA
jgi:hypothetical protein